MADIVLNDVEISNLIQERKEFPPNYEILFQTKDKKGHKEQEITLPRSDGSQFKVILRQNRINLLDCLVKDCSIVPPDNRQLKMKGF